MQTIGRYSDESDDASREKEQNLARLEHNHSGCSDNLLANVGSKELLVLFYMYHAYKRDFDKGSTSFSFS